MASQKVCFLSFASALLAFLSAAPTFGGENTPDQWDKAGAAQYLDGRGENWFKFGSANRGEGASASHCVSCHSLLPYALARPVLRRLSNEKPPTKWETKILEQTKSRVANWDQLDEAEFQLFYDFDEAKKKQSRGTEAILNALLLSLDDRFQGRQQPSDDTKKALAILWATQITDGPAQGLVGMAQFRPRTLGVDGLTIPGCHGGGDRDRRGPGKRSRRQRRRLAANGSTPCAAT